ncbi:hypothetical protein HJC23_001637 [Cyclotella cryptica]|uniref:Uncharacterized protein n=1 Tax=Cyclotella cryptica TaxID=29204 RepID=A0ABD3QK71_9STRA|eukprot:CCRYP_004678-RA/>CCRYP_004678-RA protein AED:0.04 eAED:0.04 QI:331/-1/1/1/-1/1/1/130/530
MEDVQMPNESSCDSVSYIGDVVDDCPNASIKHNDVKDSIGQLIAGRGVSEQSVDSPTLSRTSSDSDEIIDHTAALLGFVDEFEDDDDDLREISGFSPSVSLDLELEPMENEAERGARFEKIWSGDEVDSVEAPSRRACKVTPVQLNLTPQAAPASKRTVRALEEFDDNDTPVKQLHRNPKQIDAKANKALADDVPFFYFDSRLVAQAVEEYGQRKRTDIDNKRKQAALKAKALKDKASSAISHKAKKVISLPHSILERKGRSTSRDEFDASENVNSEDAATAHNTIHATKAAAIKIKAKAAFNEKARKAKDRISLSKAIKEGKQKNSHDLASEHLSENLDAMYAKMVSGIKLSNLTTPPPMRDYIEGLATKTSISVIGDINKLVKPTGNSHIKREIHPDISHRPQPPAIAACPSTVSSTNSQVIDENGFIISPTPSIDLISPVTSFDEGEAARSTSRSRYSTTPKTIASPSSMTSPKRSDSRSLLPPSGKKAGAGQMNQGKDVSNKMKLKITKRKPGLHSHRRSQSCAAF